MKKINLFKSITVSVAVITMLTGCTLLPPLHQAVLGPDDKNENQANATISVTTNDISDGNETNSQNSNSGNDITTDDGSDNNTIDANTDNDNVKEKDYLKFLNGEVDAFVSYIRTDLLMFEETYSYSEMIDTINNNLTETWYENMQVQTVDYAFIDCGNDGIPEMALHVLINTPEGYDQMDEYYIFKYFNGNLCIIDTYSAYYRSMGELNKYGIFYTYGSSGANKGYQSYTRCNADGIHEFLYSCSTENEIADASIAGYYLPSDVELPDDYPVSHDDYGKINCYAFSFEEYDYDNDGDPSIYDDYLRQFVYVFEDRMGEVVYPEPELMDIYSNAGITVTDWDGLTEIANEKLYDLGVSDEEMHFSYMEDSQDCMPNWIMWQEF